LYKQVTIGPVTGKEPALKTFDVCSPPSFPTTYAADTSQFKGKAKLNARKEVIDLSREDAEKQYIELVNSLAG